VRGARCLDGREQLACSEVDYAFLREAVLAESANVIDPARNALFESRLAPVVRGARATSLEDLVEMLRVERNPQLQRAVAEAMTINETSFFRDAAVFETLRDVVLPNLIEQNRGTKTLRIWSAASSTGQEAYSVAMLVCEHFPELADWDVRILGTDISRQSIEYARAARYRRLEVNRGLPARMLLKYLVRDGEEWEIVPRVRARCEFRDMNLCAPPVALGRFDLVLLRNVLLYFPAEERAGVFRTVHRQMSSSGYLVLGAAEQAEDSTKLFCAEFARECYFYRPAPVDQGMLVGGGLGIAHCAS
jgi:chemotaxis protein methyltransferase CheR